VASTIRHSALTQHRADDIQALIDHDRIRLDVEQVHVDPRAASSPRQIASIIVRRQTNFDWFCASLADHLN
jgi:hypothetical protein